MFSFLLRVVSALVVFALMVGCNGVEGAEQTFLVDRVEKAVKSFDGGRFPAFVDEPRAVDMIDIAGDARRCLTPPFPSRLSFDLMVPSFAFLEFSPAVIMTQDVRRARIEFVVSMEVDGRSEEVYQEVFRADRANQWYEREIDLTRWSGRTARLTLETRAVPPRGDVLWADRLQIGWGEPVLLSSPRKHLDARMREALIGARHELEEQADSSGVGPEERLMTLRFAINLLLSGLMAMYVRELYKRFCSARANRERFANMLPMFTITTTAVIFVVQYSPALSLGLVGALSIVRFRVAIATAEELSYLLLSVTLGAVLGASHVLLALATVMVVSPFVVLRPRLTKGRRTAEMLLVLTGTPERFFGDGGPSVIDILKRMTKDLTVHRLEHEPDRVVCRARATIENQAQVTELLSVLRERTTHCQFSNLDGEASVG